MEGTARSGFWNLRVRIMGWDGMGWDGPLVGGRWGFDEKGGEGDGGGLVWRWMAMPRCYVRIYMGIRILEESRMGSAKKEIWGCRFWIRL